MSSLIVCYLLATILSPIWAATTFAKPAPNPKIVIVGAGVAGIGAAVHLKEYGFEDITILEAEARIGGRIHTISYGENVIDLGAQWCHGEQGNMVYDLASKAGLLEHATAIDENIIYKRSNGENLPVDVAQKLQNLTDSVKKQRDEAASDYAGSIGSLMREKFQNLLDSAEGNDVDKVIAKEFYATFEKAQSAEEAADSLDMVSAREYNLFDTVKGDYEMNWKDKGYIAFLRLLLQTNETGHELGILKDALKLSKKVERIFWQRDDYKTLVKCEDGEEILADHVIVTVSLGVLKAQSMQMFVPPLPAEKQKVINALEFGSFAKIFLEFPQRFWPVDIGGFSFLWLETDLKDLRSSKHAWLEGLYGFNTLPYQQRVLEGWLVGAQAREVENLATEEIETAVMGLLRKFFNDTESKLPAPLNVTITKWFTNPNFRGCYSYHSLDTEKADISNQFLANTLRGVCDLDNYQDLCEKPVLQFAGEATESLHYATVHGALETGFREAQKIRDYYAYGPRSVSDRYQLKKT